METTTHRLKMDGLREDIRAAVQEFAERSLGQQAPGIESISVVGSALTEDFVPKASDINTVIIFRSQVAATLDAMAHAGKGLHKMRIAPPLLLSADFLASSRDTFPIELLDFQLNHCTIFGKDPFEGLELSKKDVRLQCERELRSTLFRLSQGYVACGADTKVVAVLLMSAVSAMTPLLRAMLWLKDVDRSGIFAEVFAKTAKAFSVHTTPLADVRKWKASRSMPGSDAARGAFFATYELVSRLTAEMDKIEA